MRVIVVRFSALGDVAMTLPVIQNALRQNPSLEITFVTRRSFSALFEGIDRLTLVGVDLKEYKGLFGLWRLGLKLLENKTYDYCIDLHDSLRTKIIRFIFWLNGIRSAVIDKGKSQKKLVTGKNSKQLIPLKHSIDRYADVFKAASISVDPNKETDSQIHLSEKGKTNAAHFLNATGKSLWIGVAPFSAHKIKEWPLKYFQQLISEIHVNHPDFQFVLFGSRAEKEQLLQLKDSKDYISLAIDLEGGMETELAIIAKLSMMISLDSANMHFSSLSSVPTFPLFGPTHPYTGFGPWKQEQNVIQLEKLACRPCSVFGNKPCHRGDHACMHQLSPEMVFEKINRQLTQN